jgi:hypothetical protein
MNCPSFFFLKSVLKISVILLEICSADINIQVPKQGAVLLQCVLQSEILDAPWIYTSTGVW